MKAIVLTEAGPAENLALQELPVPQPGAGEVLIKTKAIGINPVDVKTRKGGAFYGRMKESAPVILGWDLAGDVVAAGPGVTAFTPGDRVFGMINFPGHGRAYAEYATAPAAHLARIPDTVSYTDAAATTLAALTAWQVLVQQAKLQAGQRVLIHAAAGGVGHFAVQIARHLGATVYGTASAANADFLKVLGVDRFIDYTTDDFAAIATDIDIVLDPIGGDTTVRSLDVMKPGGVLVSIVGGAKEPVVATANEKGITAKNYLVQSSGADMQELSDLLGAGRLQPTVSHLYAFAQIRDAHRQLETGRTRGKVVVSVGA